MALSSSLFAAQPGNSNSNIEYLRPADLGKKSSFVPGSAHGHVRQRLGYGKGYRYGHGVNSALGDIIIWSPTPNRSHEMQIMRPRTQQRARPAKLMGPRLQYKPAYGKTSNSGYGN
jgi:hypothetical protein